MRYEAGMARVWVAGKTVWSPCYMRAISERFRGKWLIIKRYINSPSLLYFTLRAKIGWKLWVSFRQIFT